MTNPDLSTQAGQTHAHTFALLQSVLQQGGKKVLHHKCNYHFFEQVHPQLQETLCLLCWILIRRWTTAPNWSVLILWHITPCRLTILQSHSVNACFSHNNDCHTHYSSNWSIFFITNALFYLTHISCRIIDIYVIFRATAFCCLTSEHTACASWLCTCVSAPGCASLLSSYFLWVPLTYPLYAA